MMTTINPLYELFGLAPDCSDDELRQAYRSAILQHHPDMNPDQVKTATVTTQQLTAAYANLKVYRKHGGKLEKLDLENGGIVTNESDFVSFHFEFSEVDIEDITYRKSSFRNAWEAFRQNPTDVLHALRLVHAAFNANREDAISDLIQNPVLIDAASMLLFIVEKVSACETLTKWAKLLYENHLAKEGIQILEDAFSSGKAPNEREELLKEELRSMHYTFAQGYTSRTKRKPAPAVRIEHFNRILELGFKYGYIYKFLAEAHHELGDDTQARIHLKRAYKIDPQLMGAVRISRALGFLPAKKPAPQRKKKRAKYKYTQPEHIPSPSQIQEWAASGNWNELLAFADLTKYSPRVLPKSRSTLCQIANALGGYKDPQAQKILTSLLESIYWDVREASIVPLSEIGDQHALHLLQNLPPDNGRLEDCRQSAILYLKARLANQSSDETGKATKKLIRRAKQAFGKTNFGLARSLLESIAANIEKDDPLYFDVIILLARTCGEMGDSREATNLIKPVYTKMPKKSQHQISKELMAWLWNNLVFEPYDPANDEDYLLALGIHLDHALTSNNPDEVLGNLRHLTHWMGLLGQSDIAQWISSLVRTEAPGTWYADSLRGGIYLRQVDLSRNLKTQLDMIHNRIKTEITNKLSQVLQSPKTFKGSTHRLHT